MIPLTIIYYLVSFNPGALWAQPINGFDQPLTRAECLHIERITSGTWCQAIRVRK
jgi:hypothetical protein